MLVKGSCYNNSVEESFFNNLKTREEAKNIVCLYIETISE